MLRRGLILGFVALWAFWALPAPPVLADSVVPTRTIRAHAIIAPSDVALRPGTQGGMGQLADVIGQEARVVLYPGRPIQPDEVGPPALVVRNEIVRLTYAAAGLQIVTEGRALERGAVGDFVHAMNLSSRATVLGQVAADGSLRVSR